MGEVRAHCAPDSQSAMHFVRGLPMALERMKEKEAERRLRRALGFPRVWFEHGLMKPEIARHQLAALRRHFGTRSRPVPGSEHWRYGAFRRLLSSASNDSDLAGMLPLAHEEKDWGLRETMINDITRHRFAGMQVASALTNSSTRRAKTHARYE